jgi:membrane protein DedA with SNARE-associated domain
VIENELLHYGYLFVFVGTIFEGDATLLTAAFLAHRGYLRFSWVLLIAALATIATNQVYFMIARRTGTQWLKSVGPHGPKLSRILALSQRHSGPMLIASRFMIGFRTLIVVVCGAAGMGPGHFFAWNVAGATLWTAAFGFAGYLGAEVFTILLEDIRRHEKALAVVLALSTAGFILWKTHGRDLLDAWSLRKALAKDRQ